MGKTLICSVTKKDLEVQTFRSGGKGGQHQNKTDSGVRIVHRDSGAVGESREDRCQSINKKIALKRLASHPLFLRWVSKMATEQITGKTIEQRVDEQLLPQNLKIEAKNDLGQWEEIDNTENPK